MKVATTFAKIVLLVDGFPASNNKNRKIRDIYLNI